MPTKPSSKPASKPEHKKISIDELTTFCKRRGFVYPSAEIYGGFSGFYDYGHLGVELKNNIKQAWWKFHVKSRKDIAGIDGSIITNPKVWKASGHIESFVDVAVVNKKTKEKKKVDKHEVENLSEDWIVKGEFNPMFTTQAGPVKEESTLTYLRPETAQLIFTNFKAVQENARLKLPFGIAQIGKAFRNEISPREFLFRLREFEQMEIEYFIAPKQPCPYKIGNTKISVLSSEMQKQNKEAIKMKISEALSKSIIKRDWHAYWIEQELLWFINLGADIHNFRIRQHLPKELSHYSSDTWDLEYKFPMGWRELQGFADRGTYDLNQHAKASSKKMEIIDPQQGRILPEVVCEPSLGVERTLLVFMFDAYHHDKNRNNIILKLSPKLSPIKAAIFPIVKTDEKVVKLAKEVYEDLKQEFNVSYDASGSVGRRYSRNDEIGTPLCITTDEQSKKDKTVTIRDRDTTQQIRIKISELKEVIRKVIAGENILKLGKKVDTRVK